MRAYMRTYSTCECGNPLLLLETLPSCNGNVGSTRGKNERCTESGRIDLRHAAMPPSLIGSKWNFLCVFSSDEFRSRVPLQLCALSQPPKYSPGPLYRERERSACRALTRLPLFTSLSSDLTNAVGLVVSRTLFTFSHRTRPFLARASFFPTSFFFGDDPWSVALANSAVVSRPS